MFIYVAWFAFSLISVSRPRYSGASFDSNSNPISSNGTPFRCAFDLALLLVESSGLLCALYGSSRICSR